MLRNALRLLLVILVIALARYAIAAIRRAVSRRKGPEQPKPGGRAPKQEVAGGELQRDPVCGTYVAPATSIKIGAAGSVQHFCSTECRDKYLAASKV